MVRERLAALGSAGWVRSGRYATTARGPGKTTTSSPAPATAFSTVKLPSRRRSDTSPRCRSPRQHHTRCLADFIVHTIVAAHAAGVTFTDYYRENTLKLAVGQECLYPDCAFQLVLPDGRTFNYLVELDNHTEQIRSTKDADSWQKKIPAL